jgi:hypothetical protein
MDLQYIGTGGLGRATHKFDSSCTQVLDFIEFTSKAQTTKVASSSLMGLVLPASIRSPF